MNSVDEEIAETFFNWLMELGYTWVGERRYICSENPNETIRRFKMYKNTEKFIHITVRLWFGTGRGIICEDYKYETEDYHDAVDYNTDGKYISIGLNNLNEVLGDYDNLKYSIFVYDKQELLSLPQYKSFIEHYSNLTDLEQGLDKIKNLLKSSPSIN
jgi:hypothetical protein